MTKVQHKLYLAFFYVVGIFTTLLIVIYGADYYFTLTEERFFHELHNSLKPSGIMGHGMGIIGSLMMISGVMLYMFRKRTRWFPRIGILKHWLEFHIFLCAVGPILVLFHTAFKFGGIVAVSFWSMVAVVISGVIGRFIYVQIPRSIEGTELSFSQLEEINTSMGQKLKNSYMLEERIILMLDFIDVSEYKALSPRKIVFKIISDFFEKRRVLNNILLELKKTNLSKKKTKEVLDICRSKITLARRIALLSIMQKLFKNWHIVHLPFAIVMLIIMLVHVGVTLFFGYKWVF